MSWRFQAIVRTAVDVYFWLIPLVVINLLWLFLSITIVLLPPATAALYTIAYEASRSQEPDFRTFFGAMKHWFFKSWIWAIGMAFGVVVMGVAFIFYTAQDSPVAIFLSGMILVMAVLFGAMQFYFWPYMVMIEKPGFRQVIRNAALTPLADPIYALVNIGLTVILWIISLAFVAPLAFITPVFVAFLGVYSLRGWLEHQGFLGNGDEKAGEQDAAGAVET
ncbi:MAG: DUF624 domain-containing protein [Anaerolineae bacterium]|nr:DUF624 domain-containing protein [Anaerolineae bacterium]